MTASRPAAAATRMEHAGSHVHPTGWSIFGGVVLCLAGVVNVVNGLTVLRHDDFYGNNLVYDNLTFWGWVILAWGAVELVAGVMTLMSRRAGVTLGMSVAAISVMLWFFMIFAAPGAAIIGMLLGMSIVAALSTSFTLE